MAVVMNDDVMSVHVIDDDEVARRGLAGLLRSYGYVVETYATCAAFLDAVACLSAERLKQSCVVLDLHFNALHGGGGMEQAMEAARDLAFPVVAMSGRADVSLAVRAMKAGAVDLIEKPFEEAALLRTVAAAMALVMDRVVPAASGDTARAKLRTLSARERDVLASVLRGHPNKVIAHNLGISPRTVEIHRSKLMAKLECRGIVELVRFGLEAGLRQEAR